LKYLEVKKIPPGKNALQKSHWIYNAEVRIITMNISIKTYERELLIEALEYRIENDEELIRDYSTKEELTYLLERLSEEY
jgi:hypothetical protein